MVDDISFYKEWSKDKTKYEAIVYLTEIEDEEEGE